MPCVLPQKITPILYSSAASTIPFSPRPHRNPSSTKSTKFPIFRNSPPSRFLMAAQDDKKHVYSVWGLPPEDVTARIKKLMEGLRSEFGGPQFDPHVTVVGAIRLTESEARDKFQKACEGLKTYGASVSKVDTGDFFYQCVFLLLHPTTEVVETSDHCCRHFGYERSSPYMPHLSLLYADITDEEKKRAQEKAYALDESIGSLHFPITRLALHKTDTADKSLKSWEKVDEHNLNSE